MSEHGTWGTWIVCVRDIPGGEDDYLGPFRSQERAAAVARRLCRDIAARGAEGSLDAIVERVRPGGDIEEYRDEMLANLEKGGYEMKAPA